MRNAGDLDLLEGVGVFTDPKRNVGQADERQRRVAVGHRVVGCENFRERTLGPNYVRDQLEWFARERVVREQRLALVAGVFPLEPPKVRVDLFVEKLDRVFPAEVFVREEVIVIELDHPVRERRIAHDLRQ